MKFHIVIQPYLSWGKTWYGTCGMILHNTDSLDMFVVVYHDAIVAIGQFVVEEILAYGNRLRSTPHCDVERTN